MEKLIISVNIHCILFLRDIYKRKLTFEEADNEQSELVSKLSGIDNAVKPAEKRYFLST